MAATYSRKPGPGRPKGCPNKKTLEIGGQLTKQKQKVTRALMNEVAPDRELAILMWLCALKAKNDPRYIPAMLAVAERKWGRVKFELEHESEVNIQLVCRTPLPYVGDGPGLKYLPPSVPEAKILPPARDKE